VFNPAAWLGFILAGVAIVLIWAGSRFASDSAGDELESSSKRRRSVDSGSGSDEFADIEAILKKRGIT
jgi:hypothetical protein